VLDPGDGCRRGTLVQVLDKLLDRIIIALGLTLNLRRSALRIVKVVLVPTLPSEALVTNPVTPTALACFLVKFLNLSVVHKRRRTRSWGMPEVHALHGSVDLVGDLATSALRPLLSLR
jgi:hypothetical protein